MSDVEQVAQDYMDVLPDFVGTQFSTWVPIVVQTFSLEGEATKGARDCCDAIALNSGVFKTRQERTTGNYYLKQGKRFKALKKYRGISLGLARDIILRRLMANGVPRYYIFAKDPDSDLWYLQSTALRHQDAFMSANLATKKLEGQAPILVLPCHWPVASPLTEEEMKMQQDKIRSLAWNLDQNQHSLIDKRERDHEDRRRMAAFN